MQKALPDRLHIVVAGDDVLPLRRREEGLAIAEKVAHGRVEQVQQVQQIEIFCNIGGIGDDDIQKGHHSQADGGHRTADDDVRLAVILHDGGDFRLVLLGDGLVQGEDDGTAEAQLRKGEHGQNVGKQSVDAQIVLPQKADEQDAADKAHHRIDAVADHAGEHIDEGIFRAAVLLHKCVPLQVSR